MRAVAWTLTKEAFERLPTEECVFLLGVSQFANEINTLQKLVYCAIPDDGRSIEDHARASQALSLSKVLAGKLTEFWEFTRKAFFSSQISKQYELDLPQTAQEALRELKKYFGSKNALKTVRNDYAFHLSPKAAAEGFENAPEDESWYVVISDATGNNLYYAADLVTNWHMLSALSPSAPTEGIDMLVQETIKIARLTSTFVSGCWELCFDKYWADGSLSMEELDVSGWPDIAELSLPYFVRRGA